MHFEVDDYDRELGRTVRRSLTVQGDPEFGLPTAKDEQLYLGLLKYSNDYNNLSHPEIRFSRAALFELIGWPRSKWAYERLTTGMHRLVGVRLRYQNLWRDNRDKQWRDQGAFGILDSFAFRDSRMVGRAGSFAEQFSMFRWSNVLFQSFDSGYVKRIDYGLTRSLSPCARRLYRYLDKHFHPPHRKRITMDVAKLAYQHIGVSPGVELDKVRKRHIGPAAEELEAIGYLKTADADRFQKLRRGVWEVRFELASEAPNTTHPAASGPSKALEALIQRGVSVSQAERLVTEHGEQKCRDAAAVFDSQTRSGSSVRIPDAWFAAALQRDFKPRLQSQDSAKRPDRQVYRARRRRP